MYYTKINDLEKVLSKRYEACDDFVVKRFSTGGVSVLICCIRELADKNYITEKLIRPIVLNGDLSSFDGNFDALLYSLKNMEPGTIDEVCNALGAGNVFLAIETAERLFYCLSSSDTYFGRSVSEPNSDVTVKGPKSGFVENVEKNIASIRRIIRSEKLKVVPYVKGSSTNTRIAVLYVEDRADMKIVDDIKNKIDNIDATAIVDSGNLEMLLMNKRYALLPDMGSTEKIDKAASLLVAGRIVVLCDGSPFAISAPYVFAESIQSPEDYLKTPYYATFIRILRLFSLLISIYLPAIFFVCVSYTPHLVPKLLFEIIDKMRENIPVSLLSELLIMLVVFEMLREVGLRMPRTIGDAVGFVGSIIIGDAATQAGIASTTVILIVVIAAISNFVVPTYMNAVVLLRFLMLFLGYLFSFFGIIAGSVLLLCALLAKKSFGVDYMSPIMPFKKSGMQDFLLAIPQKTLGRRERP